MQQVTHTKPIEKRNYPISLIESLIQIPCERCPKLINSNPCDPITCSKLEDLAKNLGELR